MTKFDNVDDKCNNLRLENLPCVRNLCILACPNLFIPVFHLLCFISQGQNQSGGTGGRGDGKKDDKVVKINVFSKLNFEEFCLKDIYN